MAAQDMLAKIKEIAAETLGGSADDYDVADERVFNTGDTSRSMSYAEVCEPCNRARRALQRR